MKVEQKTTDSLRYSLGVTKMSLIIGLILTVTSWIFIFKVEGASLAEYFSVKNMFHLQNFLTRLLGFGIEKPAFLDPESWRNALNLTYETLRMSVLAISFAGIGMFLTVIPAARSTADGSFTLTSNWMNWVLFGIIRIMYIFSRAIPELIWAMLVVFMFKPGILPGAIALGLHNFGILGKLCAEVVENLEMRPIRALRANGASTFQIFIYGIVPAVMPKFLTYLLYRWEVIIRATIVVGFVAAGGLGREFRLSMSWFQYTEITLLLICYLLLVLFVDILSGVLRRAVQ